MVAINLGKPKPPVLTPRRKTRQIMVGKVAVGGDAPISVQSMCTTQTTDVNAQQPNVANQQCQHSNRSGIAPINLD